MPGSQGPTHGNGDFQNGPGSQSAINAAALVATATATATATARVVALQERQEHAMNAMGNNGMNMNAQYPQVGSRDTRLGISHLGCTRLAGHLACVCRCAVRLIAATHTSNTSRCPQAGHGGYASTPSGYPPNQRMSHMNSQMSNGPINSMNGQQMVGPNGQQMSMGMGAQNSMVSQMGMGPNKGGMVSSMSNGPMNGPQQGHMGSYPVNTMTSGGPRGRPGPYPNPQQYMTQKRGGAGGYANNSVGYASNGPANMQAMQQQQQQQMQSGYGPGSQQQQYNNSQVSNDPKSEALKRFAFAAVRDMRRTRRSDVDSFLCCVF